MVIRGPDGAEIGRGLVAYDAEDAAKIVRKSSSDILLILGIEGRAEMVHRDDMVLGGALNCRLRLRPVSGHSRAAVPRGNPTRCRDALASLPLIGLATRGPSKHHITGGAT